ncbi:MAG: hypothetical protein ACR2J4_02280, partial [Deinococcus sp.]
MINKMQQVVVAGRQRDSRAIMQALQHSCVLHIVPVENLAQSGQAQAGPGQPGPFQTGPLGGAAADERRDAERLLARTESTLG